jgi:uncharacterized membrane protein YhaH (DUF805 family)
MGDFRMTFADAIKAVYGKYAVFSGRASRPEYWWWFLYMLIGGGIVAAIEMSLGLGFGTVTSGDGAMSASYQGGPLTGIWGLAHLLPGLGVAIRRLHDTDRSGWWLLIGFVPVIGVLVLIYFYVSRGTAGENRFGPHPA